MRVWRDVNVAASEAMRPICFPSSAATARQRNNSVWQNEPCVIIRVSFSLYSEKTMPWVRAADRRERPHPHGVAMPGSAPLARVQAGRDARKYTRERYLGARASGAHTGGQGRPRPQGVVVPGCARLRASLRAGTPAHPGGDGAGPRACGRGRPRTQGVTVRERAPAGESAGRDARAPRVWSCLGARASGAPRVGDARTPTGWSCLGAHASGAHAGGDSRAPRDPRSTERQSML